jgi:hypothetical protein
VLRSDAQRYGAACAAVLPDRDMTDTVVTLADCVIDFRVLVYRERYDDSNIMGELFLRPDCTFEQVRQIIAEVSATNRLESRLHLLAHS